MQTYRTGGGLAAKDEAVAELRTALAEWDETIAITEPLYKPMLLTHFTGQSSAVNPDAEFHWKSVRPEVAADVQVALSAVPMAATDAP